mmetsp:Transcript_18820/g.41191  ORF Transcript_18820/g.41191 Transcript_18820/m.41191 type:complete len:228 (+) Transcript_18820:363-1046(+)
MDKQRAAVQRPVGGRQEEWRRHTLLGRQRSVSGQVDHGAARVQWSVRLAGRSPLHRGGEEWNAARERHQHRAERRENRQQVEERAAHPIPQDHGGGGTGRVHRRHRVRQRGQAAVHCRIVRVPHGGGEGQGGPPDGRHLEATHRVPRALRAAQRPLPRAARVGAGQHHASASGDQGGVPQECLPEGGGGEGAPAGGGAQAAAEEEEELPQPLWQEKQKGRGPRGGDV